MGRDSKSIWADAILFVVTLTLSLAIAADIRDAIFDREMSRLSRGWPSVPGLIIDSRIVDVRRGKSGGRVREARVEYSYAVDGRHYSGSRVDFSGRAPIGKSADEVVASYPSLARVDVLFRPGKPEISTLRAGGWDSPIITLVKAAFGLVFWFITSLLGLKLLWPVLPVAFRKRLSARFGLDVTSVPAPNRKVLREKASPEAATRVRDRTSEGTKLRRSKRRQKRLERNHKRP